MRFADYIGRSDQEMWVDFVARHKPPQPVAELLARKRQRMVEIIRREQPVFDGLPELVEKLAARYALALASGSERLVVEEVLKLKRLGRFFSAVVSGSEVKHGKPAPDIFLRAAELLKVAPQACCVVEDSKPGSGREPRRRHAGDCHHQHPPGAGAAPRHACRADLRGD